MKLIDAANLEDWSSRRQHCFMYVIRCKDNTFYTGMTINVGKRFEMHSKGVGAKYTKGRGPLELVMQVEFNSGYHARLSEIGFKRLARKDKERWIALFKAGKLGGVMDKSMTWKKPPELPKDE